MISYKKFFYWQKKKHGLGSKWASILAGTIIFFFIIPAVILEVGSIIDRLLGFPHFNYIVLSIVGLILVILGNFFMIWSGLSQLAIGKGTPLPMVPTKKLVIKGPYSYCRNPMALGAILDYSGFSLLKGSISAIGLTVAFFFLVVLYIKLIEEKELELRFGEEYKNYKKNTPFIIPKLGRR